MFDYKENNIHKKSQIQNKLERSSFEFVSCALSLFCQVCAEYECSQPQLPSSIKWTLSKHTVVAWSFFRPVSQQTVAVCTFYFNFGNKQLSPTWGKVYCRIKTLKSSTFQMKLACTISCEQHHLIPKMLAKDLQKGTQIVIVTSKVASILILHLHSKNKSPEQ